MTQEQKHMPDSFKPSNFYRINRLMLENEAIKAELLAALRALYTAVPIDAVEKCEILHAALNQANAAIAKAKGGTV